MTQGDYINKIQGLIIDGNHGITEAVYETVNFGNKISISLLGNESDMSATFTGDSLCQNAYQWIIDNQKFLN